MNDSRRGVAYGLVAYVVWGLLIVYWHELTGLDAFELIAHRVVWSVVFLAIVLVVTRQVRSVAAVFRRPMLVLRLALAALLLATNWTSYVWCVTHGKVMETALGYFIAPVATVSLGVVLLRERLRTAQRWALLLASLAVVELTIGYGRVPVYALLIGVSWATYGLLKRVLPLVALHGLAAETLVLFPVAAALVTARTAGGHGIVQQASGLQLVLLLLSGAVTAVPLLLFAAAARRIPLSKLGPLQYSVPTINFLFGVFVYHESLPGWRLAGFVLVWIALAVLVVDSVRSGRRAAAVGAAGTAEELTPA